jgi:hypothetical protein
MHLKNVVTLALFGTTLAGPIRKRGLSTIQEAFQQATRAILQVDAAARQLNGDNVAFQLFMEQAQQAQAALTAATQQIANQPAVAPAPTVGAPEPAAAAPVPATAAQGTTNSLRAIFPFAHIFAVANPAANAAISAGEVALVNNGILVSVSQFEAAVVSTMQSIGNRAEVLARTPGAIDQVDQNLQNYVDMGDALVNSLGPDVTDNNVVSRLRADATTMNSAIENTINVLNAAAQQAAAAAPAVAPAVAPVAVAPAPAVDPAPVVAPAAAAATAPVIVAAVPTDDPAAAPVAVAPPVAAVTPAAATGSSILDTSK